MGFAINKKQKLHERLSLSYDILTKGRVKELKVVVQEGKFATVFTADEQPGLPS